MRVANEVGSNEMQGKFRARNALCLFALLGCLALLSPLFSGAIRTEDRNHDGRPDLWRSFNRYGEVAAVGRDTNFDGFLDVQEFYDRGALVRRESDRDFNDVVDLIELFDRVTGREVRSISDVDGNGVADMQVSFHEGRPVFVRRLDSRSNTAKARSTRPRNVRTSRNTPNTLVALADPFADEPVLTGQGPVASQPGVMASSPFVSVVRIRGQPGSAPQPYRLADESARVLSFAFAVPALRGPPSDARL